MDGIFIALPVALVIAVAAVFAFIWAARRDQFEDLDTPPMRMLNDDEPVRREEDMQRAGADDAKGTRK